MAKITVFFGIVLIPLGAASFILTGSKFPTSLIPVGFGILLVIFGALAARPGTRHLKLFIPYPAAVEEKAAMAILMLIFVIPCVRSFITARRARA